MTLPVADLSAHAAARRVRWARSHYADPAMPTLLGWTPPPPGGGATEQAPRRRHLRLVHSR